MEDPFKDAFKRFKKLSAQEIPHHVVDLRSPEKFGQEVKGAAASLAQSDWLSHQLRPVHVVHVLAS